MKTDAAKTETRASDDLSTDAIFEVLSNPRRRCLLHYLSQRVGAVAIDDAAKQIALWEGDASRERYERVLTGLLHNHVPTLTDAGLVDYDPILETVTRQASTRCLAPYLELAARDDFQ